MITQGEQTTTLVIGNFDGVHLGHQQVLTKAKAAAPERPLVVLTFWPHPMTVIAPKYAPQLLMPLEYRKEQLLSAGADHVEVIEFTEEFAAWTPKRFVDDIVKPWQPELVVVGQNFRFGHRAVGTTKDLAELGAGSYEVEALDLLDFQDAEISSSRIRQLLNEAKISDVTKLLGRPFSFFGTVVHGDHRGRLLGFPTANLLVPSDYACPADGVYGGYLNCGEPGTPNFQRYLAAISVGKNPTFDGVENRRVEAFAIGQKGIDLYGLPARVDFHSHIRGMVKFDSIETLVAQMHDDVNKVRASVK